VSECQICVHLVSSVYDVLLFVVVKSELLASNFREEVPGKRTSSGLLSGTIELRSFVTLLSSCCYLFRN